MYTHFVDIQILKGFKGNNTTETVISFLKKRLCHQDTKLIAHIGLDLSRPLHVLLWHLSIVDVAFEASLKAIRLESQIPNKLKLCVCVINPGFSCPNHP